MNEKKIDWKSYFSELPKKDIERAKGFVKSDSTKLDVRTFKQRIDEQNERLGRIYEGSKSPKFNFWEFVTYIFLFIGGIGFLNYLVKK